MTRRRKFRGGAIRGAAMLVAGAFVLTACTVGPSPSGGSSTGGAPGAKADAITIDLTGYPASLDPGLQYDVPSYSVYRNIYDQLLRRDPKTLEPVPWIASKWEQTSPTEWKFTLRDDVKFSDGTPLTAEDAAFSLNRILDKSLNSAQYANFSTASKARAEGDTTLIIDTHKPSPTLISYLTTLSIVSKKYVDKVGVKELNVKPMGSGAYQLESAQAGADIKLTANPNYWGEKPSIASVDFRAVPNAATRVADIRSGRAQLVAGLSADDATQLKSVSGIKVLSEPSEFAYSLNMNVVNKEEPTSDLKVRQAIAAAVNKEDLLKNLLGGYAKSTNAVIAPITFGYPKNATPPAYDPDAAKKLLEESGLKGKPLKMITSPTFDQQVVQAIQSDLTAVGFTVKINILDNGSFLSAIQSPKHDWGSIYMFGWSCSCLDADGTLSPVYQTGAAWSSYSNPQFDALIGDARTITDAAKREEDYAKAFDIMNTDLPGVGLWQSSSIYGASDALVWAPSAQQAMFVDQMDLGGKG